MLIATLITLRLMVATAADFVPGARKTRARTGLAGLQRGGEVRSRVSSDAPHNSSLG